jgi:uncharacterized membrane protein
MVKDDQILKVSNIVNLTLDQVYNEKLIKKIVSIILIITAIIFILGILFGLYTSSEYGIILELIIILVFFYFLCWFMGIRCRLSGCKKLKK